MTQAVIFAGILVLAFVLLPKPFSLVKDSQSYQECDLCGNQYEAEFLTNKLCEMCESYSNWIPDNEAVKSYRAFQVRGYPFCLKCGVRNKHVLPLSEETTLQAYPDGYTCCNCETVYSPPTRSNS